MGAEPLRAIAPDGLLLFIDDTNGVIYQVPYKCHISVKVNSTKRGGNHDTYLTRRG
ncbi:hypothetical protein [Scytonema sp. PRP1]|uniref:hypothetical protein n=1 Tax=Scytonema sp. PRP1 TaxID=3120513 RepID=UPI002FD015AE